MELKQAGKNTYGQVLKSTALIGGSSVVNIALGIIRTKAVALILGPSGVGLIGIFGSISELVQSIASLGVRSSGVRQIAEAVASNDNQRIARTVTALRRVVLIAAVAISLLLVILCQPVAQLSFGNHQRAASVAVLALAVCFAAIAGGETALIQGMRRIADLARSNVLGSLGGTMASIAIIYVYGESGIVPSLVCVAIMSLIGVWWYSRKVKIERVPLAFSELAGEVSELLKLGIVFLLTGLMAVGVGYLIRIIVLRKLDVEAAGHYQAAWALGGLYVGFILTAMGADFFPRLTVAAHDNSQCNRLVNEQAEVSLLVAGPGVLGTLVFAPLVIEIFYSGKFGPAVEVLRWFCLGMMMRVASWPMGFILLAKGSRQAFFWSELATSLVQLALAWFCVIAFGLKGAGIAFFISYVFYWLLIYAIVRSVSNFRWSTENKRIGLIYAVVMPAMFIGPYFLSPIVMFICGSIVCLGVGIYCLKKICNLVPFERFPKSAQRILAMLGLMPPNPGPAGA